MMCKSRNKLFFCLRRAARGGSRPASRLPSPPPAPRRRASRLPSRRVASGRVPAHRNPTLTFQNNSKENMLSHFWRLYLNFYTPTRAGAFREVNTLILRVSGRQCPQVDDQARTVMIRRGAERATRDDGPVAILHLRLLDATPFPPCLSPSCHITAARA